MPIDASIALQAKPIEMQSPLDMMSKVYNMKSLAQQAQMQERQFAEDQAMRESYKKNTLIDPTTGQATLNKAGVMSDLYQINPQKAMQFQEQDRKNQNDIIKANIEKLDYIGRIAGTVKDQDSYDKAVSQLTSQGLVDPKTVPKEYDKDFVDKAIGQSMSAKDQLTKQHQEAINQRIEDQNRIKNDANQLARETKDQSLNYKYASDMKKDLDADAGRTGNFGTISKRATQAQVLQTLVKQYPDANLDNRQVEEMALGLANMLSGASGAARSQVEALVPHTWTGKMANIKEWFTSDPHGAGQQEFVKRMAETVERENDLAQKQMNQIREKRLPLHTELRQRDPQRYNALLQSYGMNPDDYDERGLRKKPAKSDDTKKPDSAPKTFKTNEIEWM